MPAILAAVAGIARELAVPAVLDTAVAAVCDLLGRDAEAAAYLEIEIGEQVFWGVGINESIVQASLRAVISGINRGARARPRAKESTD